MGTLIERGSLELAQAPDAYSGVLRGGMLGISRSRTRLTLHMQVVCSIHKNEIERWHVCSHIHPLGDYTSNRRCPAVEASGHVVIHPFASDW